jgi:serine/threonine protein kinase
MDQGRWKTVNHIFHAALEVSASERHSFVLTASEGDPDLQAEVELLLQADQDVGSYLESPLLPSELFSNSASPVKAGDVLCGRFRILRAVGEGGMGHVFEALDSELSVHVALKIIRPEIATSPEALARFRQEVRLARRITHPNVCRTFDLERETRIVDPVCGTKQEVVFLTMEFLQGETLDSRIKRMGALPFDEVLHVARQVADALQAANTLGIVHRDMKPANIMLVPSEASVPHGFRAVITDFGLARIDPVASSGNRSALSHTARPIGTLAYMAPEQLEGSVISPATDIYAFGLVLFEMVTGTRAFPSANFLSGIAQRLTGPPPTLQGLVPSLAPSLSHAIEGCLRLKPADRFQSAAEIVDVLDGRRTRLHRIRKRPFVQRKALISWSPPLRLLTLVGILLVAAALLGSAFRIYRTVANSKVSPGALVYMTQVRNQTGEKTFDNLTELIQAGLAQSMQINLLDQSRVGDILQQMAKAPDTVIDVSMAREIAMRSGAVRVVFATITGSAGSYSLNIDIQQPDSTPMRYREHWTRRFPWHASGSTIGSGTIQPEILTSIRSSSDWIRSIVGESADDISRMNVPPENVTTSDWQALVDYDRARGLLVSRRKDEAITLLQDAVRRDPGFARAYADLADNLVSIGKLSEGYQAYLNALNSDSGLRLSRKERDFIKGTFATDTHDYNAALEAFRDYSAFYERDFVGWFYQAYPLEKLDRPRDALQMLERADALSSTHRAVGEMTYQYLLLGDYASARRSIERTRSTGHPDQAEFLNGVESLCEGNYAQAEKSFARLQIVNDHDFLSISYLEQTRLLAEQGRYAEALSVAERGINALSGVAGSEFKALQLLDRAYLEFQTYNSSMGLSSIDEALDQSTAPDTIINASSIIGNIMSHLSTRDRRRAYALLTRMESSLPKQDFGLIFALARARIRGEVLLANGDCKDALLAFQVADKLDAPLTPREYLARGLLATATTETDPARATKLRIAALELYAKVALRPSSVWIDGWTLPSGFAADQMADYLFLAHVLHRSDEDTINVTKTLALLRKRASITAPSQGLNRGEPNHHFRNNKPNGGSI